MRELFKRVFKKEEGFSLIELIIVIAILAIIAAIAVPNLLANIARANVSTDVSNAKLIADAISASIAMDPALEGTTLTSEEFDAGSGEAVIDAAITVLNGSIPTLRSRDHGTIDTNFLVTLDADGVITIEGSDGTTDVTIFPQ